MRSLVMMVVWVGLLALPGQVMAEGPGWTYVEAGYNTVDVENGISDDGDGYFVGGSFGFLKNLHVFGRYVDNKTDDFDVDVNRWYAGAGWHGWLGEKADMLGELAYSDLEQGSTDGEGYFARVGVRWRPINFFELGGFARWEDVGGDIDDSDLIWEANAMVHVWRLSLGLGYELQEVNGVDTDTFNAFARFNFGG